MKLFFHLEGLALPGWFRTFLPSPQPAFIIRLIFHPSAPSLETFGLCLTNGAGAAASTACRAGGQQLSLPRDPRKGWL